MTMAGVTTGAAAAPARAGGAVSGRGGPDGGLDRDAAAAKRDGALYRAGHADPWNHVEATMALAAGGRGAEVALAFEWLAASQLPDGSWCTFHLPDGILEPRRDPTCAPTWPPAHGGAGN